MLEDASWSKEATQMMSDTYEKLLIITREAEGILMP